MRWSGGSWGWCWLHRVYVPGLFIFIHLGKDDEDYSLQHRAVEGEFSGGPIGDSICTIYTPGVVSSSTHITAVSYFLPSAQPPNSPFCACHRRFICLLIWILLPVSYLPACLPANCQACSLFCGLCRVSAMYACVISVGLSAWLPL